MTELKLRFEVQRAVRTWIAFFMQENNVSASVMTDALSASLLELKDLAYAEMLSEMEAKTNKTNENEEQ